MYNLGVHTEKYITLQQYFILISLWFHMVCEECQLSAACSTILLERNRDT